MSTLSILLESLNQGCFDCIEFGDAGVPGRVAGAVRLRLSDNSDTYQVSRITVLGGEEVMPSFDKASIEESLLPYIQPVAQKSRFARYFPLTFRGSNR